MNKRSFELPELFVDGAPVYSHVVIVGDKSQLTKEDMDKLAKFVDGSDDPMFSRLSHHEKETLPDLKTYKNNATTRTFKAFFDPHPGAHLMLISSNETFKPLLARLGVVVVEPSSASDLKLMSAPHLEYADSYRELIGQIDAGMFVAAAPKNKRQTFAPIYQKENGSLVAAWRGVKNSARVVFLGNVSFAAFLSSADEKQKNLAIKLMYDLINWWGMQSQVVRVNSFSHRVLNLSAESQCRANLHLAHVTKDHVREGNLVLIELDIEELVKRAWRPLKGLKEYKDFKDMTKSVGFVTLDNKNFQSVMKK